MFNTKNKRGYFVLVFLFFAFILLPVKSIAASRVKIGIVNLDRAGRESERGKEIVEGMKSKINREQDIIRKKEERVKELREELNKQSLIMSEELKMRKEADYRMEYRALERHIKDAQEEIQIKQREATNKILKELLEIIREVGKKNGYTYIATNEFVIYSDKAIDITDTVIREYNKNHRKIKGARRN